MPLIAKFVGTLRVEGRSYSGSVVRTSLHGEPRNIKGCIEKGANL